MNDEKINSKFLSNNPVLNDRMKKLEGQFKLELDIIRDLECLITFQSNFSLFLSKDYSQLQETISNLPQTQTKNEDILNSENVQSKIIFDLEHYPQTRDVIHLDRLANEICKSLFTMVSTFPSAEDIRSLHQAHSLFFKIINNRNILCSKFRNVFSPLSLFSIPQQDSTTHSSQKVIRRDFSNLLCQSSPYVYLTYLPTNKSLYQLQEIIGNNSEKHKELHFYLTVLLKDLNRTHKELINLKSDYQISNILNSDIHRNPPFDVVRESPIYNDFKISISHLINHVRSGLLDLHNSMDSLISEVINTLEASNLIFSRLSSIQKEFSLSNIQSNQVHCDKRKLLFYNSVINKEKQLFESQKSDNKINQYISFDHEMLAKLNQHKDLNDFSSLLNSIKNDYSKYPELIKSYSDQLNDQKDQILQKISLYENKNEQIHDEPDFNSLYEEISNFEPACKFDSSNLVSNIQTLQELKSEQPQLIPLYFEDILTQNIRNESNIEWNRQCINFQQETNEKKKKIVENNSLILNEIKKEIEEVKRRIEIRKETLKNSENSQQPSECTSKLICPICKSNIRDAMIYQCGHTFCRRCLIALCKKGMHRCPECNTFFSESNVKSIAWY